MTAEVLVLALGAILLLTGILGGGFEVKELKVPKVSWIPRLLAAGAGLFFIFLGISLTPESTSSAGTGKSQEAAQAPELVEFKVYDKLYTEEGQVSASDALVIDGKAVGTITVDSYSPEQTLNATVQGRGFHSYSLDASAVLRNGGTLQKYSGVGQGMIDVEPGKTFIVRGNSSGDMWLVTLVEQPN